MLTNKGTNPFDQFREIQPLDLGMDIVTPLVTEETNKWLAKNSKTCSCGAIIQRSGGCNHMRLGGVSCAWSSCRKSQVVVTCACSTSSKPWRTRSNLVTNYIKLLFISRYLPVNWSIYILGFQASSWVFVSRCSTISLFLGCIGSLCPKEVGQQVSPSSTCSELGQEMLHS